MTDRILLQPVVANLPHDIATLQSDAASEGYRFIDRLIEEWAVNINRFNKSGEALLVARYNGIIAGIGGVTKEPSDQTALRMRRFYVRPDYRRCGIARELAAALITDAVKSCRQLTVNAGTKTAPPFWKSVGFSPILNKHYTHVWPKKGL